MNNPLTILGIETSCDETAASVVNADGKILSNLVLSQLEEHRAFGGVVPEIAARAHIDHLHTLIKAAMEDANLKFSDLDGVAATCGPGLIGGVMIGMMAAKAIAASQNIPFIAVNHLEGHALTPRLTTNGADKIEFPYLLLLVSGGHTQLLVAEGVGRYKRLGTTLDDAAGECFDKSAKLMGLPYPGGPELQKIAAECKNPKEALKRFPLPTPMKGRKEPDFSFSGLKTAMRLHVEKLPAGDLQRGDIADLAFAFQHTMAEVIADRCEKAMKIFLHEYGHAFHPLPSANAPSLSLQGEGSREREKAKEQKPTLVVSGGVAANIAIRARLEQLCAQESFRAYAPPLALCGDNAAMIAWAGLERLQTLTPQGNPLDTKARPRWPLDEIALDPTAGGL